MDWKEKFKKALDFTYEMVKRKIADIKYPCYGGEFYRYALFLYQQDLYFYLTPRGILFTPSGASIKEIPFSDIKKLAIKKVELLIGIIFALWQIKSIIFIFIARKCLQLN